MNLSLNTGLKALLNAQFVLDTIGHNIANANTPGYSRQRVQARASMPIGMAGMAIGSGVDTLGVERSVDELLGRRILGRAGVTGALYAQLGGLSELEALFSNSSGQGLGGLLDTFFSSISTLSAAPPQSGKKLEVAVVVTSAVAAGGDAGSSIATNRSNVAPAAKVFVSGSGSPSVSASMTSTPSSY